MKKILLIVILICLISTGCNPPTKIDAADYKSESSREMRWDDYKNWMEDSWDYIKDTRYCDMVIVGTHDTGTYHLYNYDALQINEGLTSTLKTVFKVPGARPIIDEFMRPITLRKSETQEVNLYTQLMEGIRFFDLRFKRFNGDGQFRTFHGMFGDTIDDVLAQIKSYLDESSNKEIIFINLNRYGSLWDMDDMERKEIGAKVHKILGPYIFTPEEFSFTKTMSELASTGKRVVINTPPEYAETMKPTLTDYFLDQAQIGSQDIAGVVIPATRRYYEQNYKHKTEESKLNSWYQMKIQVSWEQDKEFKPALDKLKKADLIGATKKFESLLNETLKDNNIDAYSDVAHFMTHLGEEADANQPNIWLRDFYTKQEIAIGIMRNFGKNAELRLKALDDLKAKTTTHPSTNDDLKKYEYLRSVLLTACALDYRHAKSSDLMETAPFGGHGGKNDFRLVDSTSPKELNIRSADRVDKISMKLSNDTVVSAGGNGGSPSGIRLEPGEYITDISLSKEDGENSGHRLFYIRSTTNKGQVLLGGNKTGMSWKYDAPLGWYICGIKGRYGDEIDSIAMIYKPLSEVKEPDIKVSQEIGGSGGSLFNFYSGLPDKNALPKFIGLRGQDRLDNITFKYSDGSVKTAGGNGGIYKELSLDIDEYISKVHYTEASGRIHYIKFTTNKDKSIEAGTPSRNTLTIEADKGWYIAGIYGRAAKEVDSVGIIQRRFSGNEIKDVIYTDSIGGSGGKQFTFDSPKAAPAHIGLRGQDRLDSISIMYNDGLHLKSGREGGHYVDMSLGQGEYITELYYSATNDRVHHAKITTNKNRSIEAGTPTSNPKLLKAPNGWYIAGFFGRGDKEIDRLGAIYRPLNDTITSQNAYFDNSLGGEGGSEFIIYSTTKPNLVGIRGADRLDSVSMGYANGYKGKAGGDGGDYRELKLDSDEYVVFAEYTEKDGRIHYIKLRTNKGKELSVGKKQSNIKTTSAPSGYHIAGFYGRADKEIDRLGCILRKQ